MTTIQDIADKMGISKSAVSKALNNAPDISENLRKTSVRNCRRTWLYKVTALSKFCQKNNVS